MRDGLLYRALPFFNGALVFMPACSSSDPPADTNNDTDATSNASSSTDPSSTTLTTATEETGVESSTTEPADTSAGDSTDTGVPGACPEGSMCGSEPPEGWFGPTIIAKVPDGGTAPECPPEFPDAGPELFAGFGDVEPAECSCECEPPASTSCNAFLRFRNDNCYGYLGGYYGLDETCMNVDLDTNAEFRTYGGYGYYGGSNCTAVEEAAIPPVGWESTITTCRLSEEPLSCQGSKVCVPPPAENFEDTWCIYQQGDLGCPAGVFNTKSLFFTGATDTRDCSDCNCGSPGSSCGEGQLLAFTTEDCAGGPAGVVEAFTCGPVEATSIAIDYPGSGSCPVTTQPHAIGDAEPTGEFTFCCVG